MEGTSIDSSLALFSTGRSRCSPLRTLYVCKVAMPVGKERSSVMLQKRQAVQNAQAATLSVNLPRRPTGGCLLLNKCRI